LGVRNATEQDLDELVVMFIEYLHFYARDYSEEEVRSFLSQRFDRADNILLLATADGRAIGFVQVYPTLSSLQLAPAWVLNDLYVRQEGRRTGAGRALVREVCDRAAAARAAYVVLETAEDN